MAALRCSWQGGCPSTSHQQLFEGSLSLAADATPFQAPGAPSGWLKTPKHILDTVSCPPCVYSYRRCGCVRCRASCTTKA